MSHWHLVSLHSAFTYLWLFDLQYLFNLLSGLNSLYWERKVSCYTVVSQDP
jgi:hypothetical protein